MREALAMVGLGPYLTPVSIHHAGLNLAWTVLRVVEDWTTPAYYEVNGTPGETRRFRVRVSGPLPGRPSEDGEFILVIRRYGTATAGGSRRNDGG